jgi:hypothetical protein
MSASMAFIVADDGRLLEELAIKQDRPARYEN